MIWLRRAEARGRQRGGHRSRTAGMGDMNRRVREDEGGSSVSSFLSVMQAVPVSSLAQDG
jgi:hypothetical protein